MLHMESYSVILATAAFLALYIFIFSAGGWLKNLLTAYDVEDELVKKDNPAAGLSLAGYYLAITLVFIGAAMGPEVHLARDILLVGGYAVAGVVFLNISRWFNDRFIFGSFSNAKEIAEDRNTGLGFVSMGTYIATGLIAAASVHGEGGGIVTAFVFFVMGQASLFVFSYVYDLITPYALREEVEKDNTAAGIAYGGTLVALGLIAAHGAHGDFISWEYNLMRFAKLTLAGFVVLPLARFLLERLLIRGDTLGREIAEDKNVAAGTLEATIAICFALVIIVLL
ncbi:MAG: DUF350 domain-containing protein [Alphaproteobacteria bacterium]|nr:DUF350 domain-containing protein [Alphaproteobacteria bacterium]